MSLSAAAEPAALSKREQQGERSREEILDAAERLMSVKGYAATSISDLGKESGLPASSIYWHFASKSGVLGAVMERGAERYFDDTTRSVSYQGRSPRKRLEHILMTSDSVIRNHPQFLRLFMLLLLGSEGEHEQEVVVARVRLEGKRQLGLGLLHAYQPWGAPLAQQIPDELTDIAVAMFDGYFIALQADDADHLPRLLDQMIESLHALATRIRATAR